MDSKMLQTFMIARRYLVGFAATAVACVVSACERVPLLAPSGSTITLTASTNAMSVNTTATIIAQVLEAAGTPPHSGTVITFTTTLGSIEPAEARTDVAGRVNVRFHAGNANGNATITAVSGGATTGSNGALRIAVGTAAVGNIVLTASPATVPNTGGSTTISAVVRDINGNPLSGAPVSFSTNAGTMSSPVSTTDSNGAATTVLTTAQTATVTAIVGAQGSTGTGGTGGTGGNGGTGGSGGTGGTGGTSSGQTTASITINVSVAPTLVITPPTTPPSAGLPSAYTFAVTVAQQNGSAVRNLRVDWGDGTVRDYGAVTGNAVLSHVYEDDGTYTITATVTDASGNSQTVSASVTVIPVPRPTVIVTPTPQTQTVGGIITFSIQVTVPQGVGIVSTSINFGDGEVRQLGGASSVTVQKSYATTGQKLVTVTVVDTAGQSTEGTATVSITP
jgi:adhesin/invasin